MPMHVWHLIAQARQVDLVRGEHLAHGRFNPDEQGEHSGLGGG